MLIDFVNADKRRIYDVGRHSSMLSLRSPHTFALSDKQQVFTSYYAIRHGDWREDRDGRQIYAISHVTVTYDMRKRCQYISRRTTSRNADVSLPILSRDKTETHCRKLLTHDENKTQTSCVLINVLRKTSDKQRAGWKNGRDYSRHIAGGGGILPRPRKSGSVNYQLGLKINE